LANITTILFDVGGVLLTDGWNHHARQKAAEEFNLDLKDFETRHAPLADGLDTGKVSLNDYIDKVIFYRDRSFSKIDFYDFMKEQSIPIPGTLDVVAKLFEQNRYLLGTINNESTQLNLYRIEKFNLREHFQVFFSSCFMGVKKPDAPIYERALQIIHKNASETIFIDDREDNLAVPRNLKFNTIHFENADQLVKELAKFGVTI
jgi:putative hydrolase of the HAD superfamily